MTTEGLESESNLSEPSREVSLEVSLMTSRFLLPTVPEKLQSGQVLEEQTLMSR